MESAAPYKLDVVNPAAHQTAHSALKTRCNELGSLLVAWDCTADTDRKGLLAQLTYMQLDDLSRAMNDYRRAVAP